MMFEELSPPYATIVADPPWPYDTSVAGRAAIQHNPAMRHVHEMGFTPMPMDDLKAMPVTGLAAENAHLYLWVTNSFMVEGHDLCRAWGFKPKTILTWVKMKHDGTQYSVPSTEDVSMKVGYWFRGSTEHVIFGVRGSLKLVVEEGVPTAHLWPRESLHSAKPAAFGDLVERCSPGPYVELFARAPRLGWDSWGFGYEQAS